MFILTKDLVKSLAVAGQRVVFLIKTSSVPTWAERPLSEDKAIPLKATQKVNIKRLQFATKTLIWGHDMWSDNITI